MCLVQDPKLLLLDEPTAGMSRADTNDTIDLLQRIGERGITKIVIEHDMHVDFSLAQRISVMAQGAIIAEGAPQDIKGGERVRDAYLGGAGRKSVREGKSVAGRGDTGGRRISKKTKK